MILDIFVRFINTAQGGWRDLPKDIDRYACTMRVFDPHNLDMERQWSFVIEIEAYNYETGKFRGHAHFLVDPTPSHLDLHVGSSIELFEGNRFVAHGVITVIN